MKRKSYFPQIIFILCLLTAVAWASYHSLLKFTRNLKKQLEAEIRQEMRSEVRDLVALEVNTYLASRKEESVPVSDPLAQDSAAIETKRDAIVRIVDEVLEEKALELSNGELDNYVAARMEQETQIEGGFRKNPAARFELASAKGAQAAASGGANASEIPLSADELDLTAGKERAESLERTLVQRGGLLLPRGTLQIEPSLTWAHFSSNKINIQGFSILPVLVIGQISTETIKRDIMINTWAFKYGLWHNLQMDLKVPGRFEHDRVTDTAVTESTREYGGLGDIEVGFSRQIGAEHGLIPDLIANMSVKTPTGKSPYNRDIGLGTGHWSLRGSLVAAKSSDPAVVFGSLNYTWNIKRDIENFGEIDPGDSIGYSLGTAIALSYQTAITFSYDHSVTFKMMKDKRVIPGSFLNSANFKTGLTWSISERSSVDFSVGIGLTSDAPDVTTEFRFPFRF